MNFGFSYSQRKPLGFPLNMRQFSTFGVQPAKFDGFLSKTGQYNVLNAPIISNKCFDNPNYVNKNYPNILAPSVAGIVKFDRTPQNYCVQQPKCDRNFTKHDAKEHIIKNETPEESSQEEKDKEIVKIVQEPNLVQTKSIEENYALSPKMSRRNKRKKRKQAQQNKKGQKSNKSRNKKCGNGKKSKPWHKTNMDFEIMELSESTLDSDSSNMIDEPMHPYCITIDTKTPAMDIKPDSRILNIEKTDSSMSISPCHHEILKTLGGCFNKSDLMSSCSPVVRKFRIPSECESEDSFIVFTDQSDDTDETFSEDDSDFEEETDSDESDCDIQFSNKCDNRVNRKKQVSFKKDAELCEVHPMIQWGYAYQTARVGPWEQLARDRARFEARIRKTEETLAKILSPTHRAKMYKERFEETTT